MRIEEKIRLENMDCLELLRTLPDNSIDLLLQDPPYNTTNCDWDVELNFKELWIEWERVCKPNAAIIFTASQPFTTDLINSNRKLFRYEWIWQKNRGNNFMNLKYMPFKEHENILVFYKEKPTYNPQRILRSYESLKRDPIGSTRNCFSKNTKHSIHPTTKVKRNDECKLKEDGLREPSSVIYFEIATERKGKNKHQTAKPLNLFRYLIKTYSNENDTIFDGFTGSGTTAIACIKENRFFIGAELDKDFYDYANKEIDFELSQPKLF
jgi:site-specific DNA-methyltransferase (adenine-specific)